MIDFTTLFWHLDKITRVDIDRMAESYVLTVQGSHGSAVELLMPLKAAPEGFGTIRDVIDAWLAGIESTHTLRAAS